MESRMDRYNATSGELTRSKRNQSLYEEVKTSSLNTYDVNSNISVIAEDASKVSMSRVRKMLDDRYSENTSRRVSIEIPEYPDLAEEEENIDTREYDINAILEKAKQGKNVDYNKERLKKVRETQYDILSSLDLSLKRNEEPIKKRDKAEEDNLMELINTITQLELKNKEEVKKQDEISTALDLLSDLSDEVPIPEKEEKTVPIETPKEEEITKTATKIPTATIPKIDINNDYSDFSDISKSDKSAIILKIIIYLVIIGLVVGGIYLIDKMLNLNLL